LTTVDQIQGGQAALQASPGGGMRAHFQKILQPVADKLGMSADDLSAALKGGKSLAEIAQSKGISRDDLVATVADAITKNRPPGSAQGDATQMANRMVDHVRGGHRGHHAHGAGAGGQDPDDDGDRHGAPGAMGGLAPAPSTAGSLKVDAQA
jgi:hypothetical protein